MKIIQILSLGLLALALHLGTAADAADANREADHVALRQLRDKITAGINNLDAKALTPCFAKGFAFTTVTQTVLTNQAQIQDFFDQMFHSSTGLLTGMHTEPTADILTRFIDQNTGVCYGSTKDTYTLRSGQTVTMNLRWSATVVKEDGQWKVALAHAGTDFLNNPVLTKVSSFWRSVAIGSGIGGGLLGLLLGVMLARRKKT
ncbi:MAG TPA: DUF4440 domain-containing protein [Bacillota bacterium]|nr:DUF4440 domain-containing protein [Bacillota bacterium]